jgi:hypothetical protein
MGDSIVLVVKLVIFWQFVQLHTLCYYPPFQYNQCYVGPTAIVLLAYVILLLQ